MANVKELYRELITLWKNEAKNLDEIGNIIDELKMGFLSVPFLPTSESAGTAEGTEILQLQRDVLEISALFSVMKEDIPGFQRTMSQLKHYYSEVEPILSHGESPLKYQMLGLDLMCLLSQNKLPEFHMELELIPPNVASSHVYIDTAVKLEQYLVEGGYNKIFLSKANMPSPYYSYFVDILLDTVRDEIAQCMEKTYEQLGVQESARMLFFDGADAQQKVLAYAKKRDWKLSKDNQHFLLCTELGKGGGEEHQYVDAKRLAEQNIFYAKQLEMIV